MPNQNIKYDRTEEDHKTTEKNRDLVLALKHHSSTKFLGLSRNNTKTKQKREFARKFFPSSTLPKAFKHSLISAINVRTENEYAYNLILSHRKLLQLNTTKQSNVNRSEDNSEKSADLCLSRTELLIVTLTVISILCILGCCLSFVMQSQFWKRKVQKDRNFKADKWWSSRSRASGLLLSLLQSDTRDPNRYCKATENSGTDVRNELKDSDFSDP